MRLQISIGGFVHTRMSVGQRTVSRITSGIRVVLEMVIDIKIQQTRMIGIDAGRALFRHFDGDRFDNLFGESNHFF